MKKLSLLLVSFCASPLAAATIQYTVTLNTSSISGTNGSIDFALYPGAGSNQALSATVFGFSPVSSPYTGTETPTGSVTGGPAVGGKLLTLGSSFQDNDDLETFKYGTSLTFTVDITGPALSAPNGSATSPYEFVFSTYSDADGITPVLTTDPGGAAAIINISGQGVVSTSAVSPQATIAATPEPATFCMFVGALAIVGATRYSRRRNTR